MFGCFLLHVFQSFPVAEGSHSGAAAALASVAALTGSAGPTVGMALSAAAGAAVAAVVAHSAPRLLQCHPPRATWTGAHALHFRGRDGQQHRTRHDGRAWGRRVEDTTGTWTLLPPEVAYNNTVDQTKYNGNEQFDVEKFCTACGSSTNHRRTCTYASRPSGAVRPACIPRTHVNNVIR